MIIIVTSQRSRPDRLRRACVRNGVDCEATTPICPSTSNAPESRMRCPARRASSAGSGRGERPGGGSCSTAAAGMNYVVTGPALGLPGDTRPAACRDAAWQGVDNRSHRRGVVESGPRRRTPTDRRRSRCSGHSLSTIRDGLNGGSASLSRMVKPASPTHTRSLTQESPIRPAGS